MACNGILHGPVEVDLDARNPGLPAALPEARLGVFLGPAGGIGDKPLDAAVLTGGVGCPAPVNDVGHVAKDVHRLGEDLVTRQTLLGPVGQTARLGLGEDPH